MVKAKFRDTTAMQSVVGLEAVPPHKWARMIRRTLTGASFAAVGVVGAALWSWPWYVAVGLVGLGVHLWSAQIVNASLRSLIPLIRELVGAVKGDKSDG